MAVFEKGFKPNMEVGDNGLQQYKHGLSKVGTFICTYVKVYENIKMFTVLTSAKLGLDSPLNVLCMDYFFIHMET